MSFYKKAEKEAMVDALEDGKIVTVSESYAKREALPILRRRENKEQTMEAMAVAQKIENVKQAPFDTLRRSLRRDKDDITSSLAHNFHWMIAQKRKERNLTRKQLAEALGASEYEIKMLENGVAPSNDFILISRLENYLGISLRSNGERYNVIRESLRKAPVPKVEEKKEVKEENYSEELLGEIELDLGEEQK